jgi:lysophospholipase L1-like esterase
MFGRRLTCSMGASLVLLSGCAQTPTSPTAAAPNVAIGAVPQTTTPVPPRITVAPARAVGVTRLVAFGDSITWGASSAWDPRFLFAAANGGYAERVEAGLNTYHPPQRFTVVNDGQPGEMAVNAVARFRLMLTTRRPEAVLLVEGINDLNNDISVSRVVTALRQMVDAAVALGIPVLIGTMYPTYAVVDPDGHFRHNGSSEVPVLNAEIRRIPAGRLNVHVVDLEPAMRQRRFVGNDGIHLEDSGFEVMASTFLAAIETAFPVRGSFQ